MKHRRAKKVQNRRRHSAALQNAETRELLRKTKNEWDQLGPFERGNRICDLLERGCSIRGLRDELHYKSEGTILRYKNIGKLPANKRDQVKPGTSPNGVLLAEQEQKRRAEYESKLKANSERIREIDGNVQILVEYMDSEGMTSTEQRYQLLDQVRLRVGMAENANENDPINFPLPTPAPKGADPKRIICDCRPKKTPAEEEVFWFETCAQQLTQAMFRIAPDPQIRRATIGQAMAKY